MAIAKVDQRENAYLFEVSDTLNETEALEIFDRFKSSRYGPNGFFAYITLTAGWTGTIQVHLGPTKDRQTHIDELDMVLDGTETSPCTFDIETRAHYVKLVLVATSGAFTGEVVISR